MVRKKSSRTASSQETSRARDPKSAFGIWGCELEDIGLWVYIGDPGFQFRFHSAEVL